MKTKWEAMADEKNLVATAFPETEDVDSYISEITSKASRSGVLLTDISLDQQNSGGAGPESGLYLQRGFDRRHGSGRCSSPQPPAATAAQSACGTSDASGLQNLSGSSSSCLKAVAISLKAKGSWEQMLGFFQIS